MTEIISKNNGLITRKLTKISNKGERVQTLKKYITKFTVRQTFLIYQLTTTKKIIRTTIIPLTQVIKNKKVK